MTMPHRAHTLHDTMLYIVQVATDPMAIAASATLSASSPWWLPSLREVHDLAAEILPIIGCTLGALQIALLILKQFGWGKS